MKLQHLFTSATVLTLLLAGCSHNEKQNDSAKQEAKSKTDNKKSEHKSTSKKENEANKDEQQIEKAVSQLTINEKIALAMFLPQEKTNYMISADELLNNSYIRYTHGVALGKMLGDEATKQSIQEYHLNKMLPERITNVPQNVKFYEPEETKQNFAELFGFTGNQIIIAGSQSPKTYDEILKDRGTHIYNLEDLYKQYGHNPNFKKVVSLVKVSDSVRYPKSDNASSPKEADSASSSTEQKHKIVNISKYTSFEKFNAEDTRTVLKLIEEYDGHPIDTNKYDVTVNKANHNDVAQVILKRKNSTRLDYEYTVYQDGQVFKLEYSE
ncbi:hypothetical protein [Staphylococcus simulans]|uniref:hypothetical protein n=1 Tax=Staphylococcus simulans TaxID=1286 RepID=UPI000D1E2662|nr:hypothetical protein [Staphylococcus simulans]PTJ92983.1 hypothetical protein BU032_00125 [Staphylococcus simulans]